MANRNFHPGPKGSENDPINIWIQVTGATDVNANGYTINRGAGYLAESGGATKASEGVLRLKLRDSYNALLMAQAICDKADTVVELDAHDVDGSAGSGNVVDLKFASGGSAADPDSTVILIKLELRNSSVSHG